jgi:ABC-2 type transport system permease protein
MMRGTWSRLGDESTDFCSRAGMMIRGIWSLARLDLMLWGRMPLAIASALIPPLGMAILLVVLSLSVTQEPVSLVVQSQGRQVNKMVQIIESDTDAYYLHVTDASHAAQLLKSQEVAGVITIPPGFEQRVAGGQATVDLTLNNIDIDFADDIRRSVERSVAKFDAPQLSLGLDEDDDSGGEEEQEQSPNDLSRSVAQQPNPYLINIDEQDLRQTDVDFLHYQVLPALVFLVLSVGLIGTALLSARDVERGTARHLFLSPLPAWSLITGRLLGGFLASMAVLIPVLGLCLMTGVVTPPPDHWPALAALFVATGLCASGLGAIMGTLTRGTRTIAMATSIVATYLFFMGGGFTTIQFLPVWLQDISAWDPIRYAIDGIRQALFYPNLTGIGADLVVLTATALAALILGSIAIRRSWAA